MSTPNSNKKANSLYSVVILGGHLNTESMIEAMQKARIFSLDLGDGFVVFREECDGHFAAKLNKEQLLVLAQELIDLAEKI
jgi:hypothetical protein